MASRPDGPASEAVALNVRSLLRTSRLTALWTLGYGLYRSYYALGGTIGMFGTIDRKTADLQGLFFNEPWFFIEGLLWAATAWTGALRESPRPLWWVGGAIVATIISTAVGVPSAFGVIGRMIVG